MTNTETTTLVEQDKKARIVLDRLYDAFIEIDSNNSIVDWNARAEITFGWTRKQVIGKTLSEVIIPARSREIHSKELKDFQTRAQFESTISNKQIELFTLRSDGQEFVAEMTVFPVPSRSAINLGLFIRNISGRKIAEKALSESEEHFRLLLSGISEYAIIMLDPQGVITTWNDGAQRIYGYTPEEIIGKDSSCFYTTDHRVSAKTKQALQDAVKYGRYEEDILRLRKTFSQFWANVVITPIYDRQKTLVGFAEVTRDISEWKTTDQHSRRLLELAPDAVVVINQQGNIVLINSQTENIFGYNRKELLGQTVEKLIPDRSKFLMQEHTKSVTTGLELYALRKDGTEFPIEISLCPLKTEEGLLVSSAIRDITERKQFELDLLKQKELFQIILDSLADGVIVADAQGRFLVINQAAQQMTGINYIEVPIDNWSQHYGWFLPDTITPYPTQNLPLVRAMRGEKVEELEMFIRNQNVPNGIALSAHSRPIALGNGAGNVGMMVIRNISERKEAEQTNAQLAAIVESTDDAIISANMDNMIVSWNAAATRMFGYSKEEAIGKSNSIIRPIGSVDEETNTTVAPPSDHYSAPYETVRQAKNGALIPVSLTVSPIRDQTGKIIGASKIARNIGEQNKTRDALQSQAELLNLTHDTIMVRDLDGTIRYWNHGAQEMYGFTEKETIGRKLHDLLKTESLESLAIIEAEIITKGRWNGELTHYAQNGQPIVVASRQVLKVDAQKKPVAILEINHDITEHKKAERKLLALAQELKRSNYELQQFASVASHDLQEPLRGIVGCLEILEETYKGKLDDKVDRLIRHAVDGASRMHALIEDLLSLSRVTTKATIIQPTSISLMLARALENLEAPVKESQAIITHDAMPILPADSIKLILLFQNLISNAIKFRSDEIPEIHIGAKKENDYWLFSVRDNGIGLKQEYTDRIFLPFRRLHTQDKYPGTGIGLAICKKIVEQHGGSIWAESEPNKGATFYFTIKDPMRKL